MYKILQPRNPHQLKAWLRHHLKSHMSIDTHIQDLISGCEEQLNDGKSLQYALASYDTRSRQVETLYLHSLEFDIHEVMR